MPGGGARGQNLVHIEHQYSKGLLHVFVSKVALSFQNKYPFLSRVLPCESNLCTQFKTHKVALGYEKA